MITRQQFKEFMQHLQELREKDQAFAEALQNYTDDQDFTGFWKSYGFEEDWLADLMDDADDYIGWFLYEKPEGVGLITEGEKGKPGYKEWHINTLDDLYDFLVEQVEHDKMERLEEVSEEHTQTTLDLCARCQTMGVNFALQMLEGLIGDTDRKTEQNTLARAKLFIKEGYKLQTHITPNEQELELIVQEEEE